MGDVVNLNRFRKAKAKAEAEETAAANRARYGKSAAERKREEADDLLKLRRHEGHKLVGTHKDDETT
jgi:hypothetical protein